MHSVPMAIATVAMVTVAEAFKKMASKAMASMVMASIVMGFLEIISWVLETHHRMQAQATYSFNSEIEPTCQARYFLSYLV